MQPDYSARLVMKHTPMSMLMLGVADIMAAAGVRYTEKQREEYLERVVSHMKFVQVPE